MQKLYFIFIALFSFSLAACEESNSSNTTTEPNNPPLTDPIDENVEEEENKPIEDEATRYSETEDTTAQNNLIEEYEYDSEEEAINTIKNYYQVKQTNMDLGHNIKAFSEGAAGHQYISWNEGKWLIEINFPTDTVYAIENYENAEVLAKEIVIYLEEHFLPPPDERGKIAINGFREHPETIIEWQEKNNVYVVQQQTANPLETLQIAVDYANER